jgi:NADPH-ferrihemoprotein reductase
MQTGTAERFAKQLGKELSTKYGDSTAFSVVDVENYGAAELLQKEKLVILCMATYGDGEPTDNAAEFYKWLLKEAEEVDGCEKEPFLSVSSILGSWEVSRVHRLVLIHRVKDATA